ncbi:uncharacterized protein [Diabrotica undecimpunctata]|uniref:uncharacterized protein n=1 Tax=Diabrotica undecimpunctata TaxID=50387 RepID=UPI003B634691
MEATLEDLPPSVSFEDLLLKTVKPMPRLEPVKKTRVIPGAEVITSNDYYQKLQEKANNSIEAVPSTSGVKYQRKIKSRRRKQHSSSSSDELSDIDPPLDDDSLDELSDIYPPLDDDSLDNDSLDDLVEDILDDDMGNNIENLKKDFESGQWLVVKYTGKKSVKHFIGTIVGFDQENNNPIVKFTKKKKNNNYTFYWPANDDTDTVSRENIVMILPDPVENRRGKSFQFSVSFKGLNFVCSEI